MGNTNFYVWPQVRIGNKRLGFGEPEYRDGLCSFIGQAVVGAEVFFDDGVVLQFELGELVVSPDQIRSHEFPEVIDGAGGGVWAPEAPWLS